MMVERYVRSYKCERICDMYSQLWNIDYIQLWRPSKVAPLQQQV